jgi:uncharacterized membrane protein YbhN (UPF0104 family)
VNAARIRRIATVAGVVVLFALLIVAARRIEFNRVVAELRTIKASWLIAAILSYLSILPLWALQWRLLAPQTPRNNFRRMLGVIAMTSSTHNTTVFLVGEATGALLLTTQIGIGRSAAVSVIAMDQLIVGIAKLGVLTAAAMTLTLPSWMAHGVTTLAIGVALLLAISLVAAWKFDVIRHALEPMRSLPRGGGALVLAFVKMLAEFLAIICVQHAFGVTLPYTSAILVLAALNLATLVPIIPGNLGVYEGVVAFIYTRLGIPTEQAVGMAVIQHLCFFVALALPGYAWLLRTSGGQLKLSS